MEKISELLNYLGTCDLHKKSKNSIALKSQLEKYSDILIRIGLGLYAFIFILALFYKFIYPLEELKLFVLYLEIIPLFSLIFGMLFQIIPAILHLKNFTKESQNQLIKTVKKNDEIIKTLSNYDKKTLEDSKDHIQLKINSNKSKNSLCVGQNVTIIFLFGFFYSYDKKTLDLLTIFSKIFGQNYSFGDFLSWALFSLILGFYLGAFSLSIENKRLNYYIDLINMALKRQDHNYTISEYK
ncbi:hypothetical protein GA0061081_104163 [Gilliamella bombicola]|uniref:Uncharacterized protein n=1 Tax=Gilliamella bombicola TaxID=1798182 RepID=A0A1C4BHF6_9GAMM|nr:hypothetical protein [Gilliamella bombicola]SCC06346.1 hypothetical protein GA0061081_104163 [Gilliamella bombicola]